MAIPNIQTIDLAQFRETSPTPTSDIKFTFEDKKSGAKLELHAHKLVLAVGCEVFMAQFYGLHPEDGDTIPVEDSSYDAFKILLELLYNKKVSFENLGFSLLAELYTLADKLLLDKIKDSIIQEVSSRKLVSGKLLEAAIVAEDQVLMGRFSEALYQVCVKFVNENIRSVYEIFDSLAPGEASFSLHRLMAKANRISPIQQDEPPVCENCKHSPCLHGQVVNKGNFVTKSKVTVYNNYTVETFSFKESFLPGKKIDSGIIMFKLNDALQCAWSEYVMYKCKCVSSQTTPVLLKSNKTVRGKNS